MSVISIRFNNEEENVIKNYAKAKGFSISQLIKKNLNGKNRGRIWFRSLQRIFKSKRGRNFGYNSIRGGNKRMGFRIEISEKLKKEKLEILIVIIGIM